MEDLNIVDLELRIDSLLDRVRRLKNENVTLKQQLKTSDQHQETLQRRNRSAASVVRQMIAQLRNQSYEPFK